MPAQGVVEMNPPREIGVVKVGGGALAKHWAKAGLPSAPQDLERIHATWRRIEAFGYRVQPVLDYDYIALPRSDG